MRDSRPSEPHRPRQHPASATSAPPIYEAGCAPMCFGPHPAPSAESDVTPGAAISSGCSVTLSPMPTTITGAGVATSARMPASFPRRPVHRSAISAPPAHPSRPLRHPPLRHRSPAVPSPRSRRRRRCSRNADRHRDQRARHAQPRPPAAPAARGLVLGDQHRHRRCRRRPPPWRADRHWSNPFRRRHRVGATANRAR